MAGPDDGGGAPRRKRAVLLVLRYYGGQLVLLRRFALPGMLLPALGSTGIAYVAPLIVAALIGRFAAHGAVTAGEAVPYVLGFAGLLLFPRSCGGSACIASTASKATPSRMVRTACFGPTPIIGNEMSA